AFKSDLDAIANAARNFFPGVKARIGTWIDRYKRATAEDQAIMGAELVGEIEAFLATFASAGAKAAQVGPKSTITGELAAESVVGRTSLKELALTEFESQGAIEMKVTQAEFEGIQTPFISQALKFPVMNDIERIGAAAAD